MGSPTITTTSPPACQGYEFCESDDGVCRPYAECLTTCSFNCVISDDGCSGGLNPTACNIRPLGCLDSRGVDQACHNAATALASCEEDAGCSEIADDDAANSCTESSCCTELQAVY
ncbi:hypothetical protein DL240_11260 [Lujinxingia litoralis]|uniref:Uncharacterized protein n=1 Tax=Lujinxingia litoralis TaxID=2211119 RepID=A0A328C785_9DELT|nr:hypothetical protein [Lujinxingia litoralis]RAL22418.1 hypothetical protein DL240_11260 [Lujinxingia litoralis]